MLRTNDQKIGVAVAGLGTVGVGVLKILTEHKELLNERSGVELDVVAVSARDRAKDRKIDLAKYDWFDNAVDMAGLDSVGLVVELIGGSDGPAYALAKETLSRGKHFITANKALIATHGAELSELAEANGGVLRFEAAVAGGIPIIKALSDGLVANRVSGLYGILNGTCNYILTRMEREGLDFDVVLKDAQDLGYAEADPTFDIDGIDTAHKTVILSAIAFGSKPDLDNISIDGIRHISSIDIEYARELGYRIKLLGVARQTESGIEQRVNPCMVAKNSAIADVHEAVNAVVVECDFVGQTVYEGAGAGEGPTASAVVADILDVARGNTTPAFSVPASKLKTPVPVPYSQQKGRFYMRIRVEDQPGVIADITAVLRDQDLSIDSFLQRGEALDGGVYVVFTTHRALESAMKKSVTKLQELSSVLEKPVMLRIEHL